MVIARLNALASRATRFLVFIFSMRFEAADIFRSFYLYGIVFMEGGLYGIGKYV